MEECESLDSEMTELQEFQSEASEAISQDDEDEVEELQNSLREIVQDQSVKPKLQCLMVDPSFSMVTVQSEDSGIVWETASSRCSTPWASETSSFSEAYSMEGSGAAGKITIVFDEEKIVRRRTRSGGRSSRLRDRLSRPGSSRSASTLGVERLEMTEVSVPNIKEEKSEKQPGLDEIKNKDQQLFSLISEGYEILNIRVPFKLPTVDEEESTELQDNLSYLDQTPKIKSRNHQELTPQQNHVPPEEEKILHQKEPPEQEYSQPSADTELRQTAIQKESTNIDYFEKFTLVDVVVPGEHALDTQQEAKQFTSKPQIEEQKSVKEAAKDSLSASEESFVFVSDAEIVGEHLDEVFYGEGAPADAPQQRDYEAVGGTGMRMRRESQRSAKESGSMLFESEETILTPIFISPGPPKIIDPILLEEPTAMSFMYSDLYEDAVGERRTSDEEHSESESVTSEKTYKRCPSDSEEADGYLEKFILKDETPTVEVQPESVTDRSEGKMIWSQSRFEMTGCLTRVVKEDDTKTKTEEAQKKEVNAEDRTEDLKTATFEEQTEQVRETEKKWEKVHFSTVTEEHTDREVPEKPIQESEVEEDQIVDQDVKHEVKRDQTEPSECNTGEELPRTEQVDRKDEETEHQRQKPADAVISETDQLCPTGVVVGKAAQEGVKVTVKGDVIAPVCTEVPQITAKSEIPTEATEKSLCDEAAADTKTVVTGEKVTEAPVEVEEHEFAGQEAFSFTKTDTSDETSQHVVKEAAEIVPEDAAPVEVITDCDAAVHAVVEVTEKAADEKEIQTQVQIDLQEARSIETADAKIAVPQVEETCEIGSQMLEFLTDQESEAKPESEVTKPAIPDEAEIGSEKKQPESKRHQQGGSISAPAETKLTFEAKEQKHTEDSGNKVHEMVDTGDELFLLVPKGQAVEMDIEINQLSKKSTSDTVAIFEPDSKREGLTAPPFITVFPGTHQAPNDRTMTESQLEVKPKGAQKAETSPSNALNNRYSPLALLEEANTEEHKVERDFEKDESLFSPLRSFTPQEDLSGLHRDDIQSEANDVTEKAEMSKTEDATQTNIVKERSSLETALHEVDKGLKMTPDEVLAEAPEVTSEELEYEVICEQEAKEMQEPKTLTVEVKTKPEHAQGKEEGIEMEVKMEGEKVFDLSAEEERIEEDYEFIDAEEVRQARLAAELQGMDWFCLTCGDLLSEEDSVSGDHLNHEVTAVDRTYDEIKEKLGDWISELQGRSEKVEDLVSELELAYNCVEEHCAETEAAMQAQNEEMIALVMEQYNNMSITMEEEKKAKLEQLYDQIVSFQENIDTAKATLETTAREAETEARSPEDIHARLKVALETVASLELGPKVLLVFEDYAKGNSSSSHLAQHKGIPVPQRPSLQPQEPGSATSTSVTVYWKVNPDDIIDCYQVYCMEDPQGVVSEEYRVTVKESYCALEELEPDKTYKVWVMAVNYTGCSLPSERLSFRTAPSVPVIDTEHCTIMWDSATLRWSSTKENPEQSYTLEYCRQYEVEGEGLRSISGIKSCEQKVFLQPNENYLFYIKAVNEAGSSEQSEAALISTKGTKFHLLKSSAHPALELSVDQTTLHYSHDAPEMLTTDRECPSILGELLLPRGRYYWETIVSSSPAYRLGVAYSTANRSSRLGENSQSWCLQCIPTQSGYQLLHNDVHSTMFVTEVPERVGTLLDYQLGRLSFYNAQIGQLLGTFCEQFTQPCHPALALEMPGSLEVSMVLEIPEFTKYS